MNSLADYRDSVNELLTEQRLLNEGIENYAKQLGIERTAFEELEQAQTVFQEAVKLLYNNLSTKLGGVITEGLSLVFPDFGYSFIIEFVERRNNIEADLYLVDADGNKYHPLNAVGGGIADFISLLLRVTYLYQSQYENILIADEPLKFIDREDIGLAADFIRTICSDLKFQMILVTHIPEVVRAADKIYHTKKVGKVSKVKEIERGMV